MLTLEDYRQQLRDHHNHHESVWCADYGCGDIRTLLAHVEQAERALAHEKEKIVIADEAALQMEDEIRDLRTQLHAAGQERDAYWRTITEINVERNLFRDQLRAAQAALRDVAHAYPEAAEWIRNRGYRYLSPRPPA